jgi:hypothetical protein
MEVWSEDPPRYLPDEQVTRNWGVADGGTQPNPNFRRARLLRAATMLNDVEAVTNLIIEGVVASSQDEVSPPPPPNWRAECCTVIIVRTHVG